MEKVGEFDLLPKKEVTILKTERDKLEKNLGGIKEMRELPGAVILVDPNVEHICVNECKILDIPMVALCDTNGNPDGIDYVIPGNDDAIRSVKLIIAGLADAVIEAREGVSMKKESDDQDEDIDIEKVLAETKPNLEIAEAAEENKTKKNSRKKPSKKKVEKKEKPAEVKEEKTEEKAETETKAETKSEEEGE